RPPPTPTPFPYTTLFRSEAGAATGANPEGAAGTRAFTAGQTTGRSGAGACFLGGRGTARNRNPLFRSSFCRGGAHGVWESARGRHDPCRGPHQRLPPARRVDAGRARTRVGSQDRPGIRT